MNLEEKKAEVLKALESCEVSQRSIDSTKGRNARQLRQGEAIGEKPINRMYQALMDIRKRGNEGNHRKAKLKKTGHRSAPQSSDEHTRKLIEENHSLKASIAELKKEIADLKQAPAQPKKEQQDCYTIDEIVKGFRLKQEKTITTRFNKDGTKHTMEYTKYYAKKRISGKLHRIYIGEILEKGRVDAKIKAYLERCGIIITE